MKLPPEIPVIDLSPLQDNTGDAEPTIALEIRKTLSASGFAYIVGHGIDVSLENAVQDASKRFFALPEEQKRTLSINDAHRGYMAPNGSLIVTSSVAKISKPNQSESILFLHDDPNGGPLDGENQWPDESNVEGFRIAVDRYRQAIHALGATLARLIALSLGQPADAFANAFARPTTWFRLLHYPPQKPEPGLFGSAPHTDYGFITLLAQDDVGGLEIRPAGRADWIPAPPLPGSLILNVGDMLARWSNGLYPSTPHRVTNRSGKERYSHPFFFDPAMDATVAPLPGLGKPKFEPVQFGNYVMERLDKNYSYRTKQ